MLPAAVDQSKYKLAQILKTSIVTNSFISNQALLENQYQFVCDMINLVEWNNKIPKNIVLIPIVSEKYLSIDEKELEH